MGWLNCPCFGVVAQFGTWGHHAISWLQGRRCRPGYRGTKELTTVGNQMGLVGAVDRIGLGVPSMKAGALFFFDDALVVAPLGVVAGAGFRANKRSQAAVMDISRTTDLTPDLVKAEWNDSVILPLTDIDSAELGKAIQGRMFGTLDLRFKLTDGHTRAMLAHRSVRDPLKGVLSSLLGERFKYRI
jgi:hypothetical protein